MSPIGQNGCSTCTRNTKRKTFLLTLDLLCGKLYHWIFGLPSKPLTSHFFLFTADLIFCPRSFRMSSISESNIIYMRSPVTSQVVLVMRIMNLIDVIIQFHFIIREKNDDFYNFIFCCSSRYPSNFQGKTSNRVWIRRFRFNLLK